MNMKCPNCTLDLVISERQGVEIDYCPQCRGVWLDRGELDKILERSVPAEARPPARGPYDDDRYDDRKPGYGKRRKSWLEEIFD